MSGNGHLPYISERAQKQISIRKGEIKSIYTALEIPSKQQL
jgi:hypothetical protein